MKCSGRPFCPSGAIRVVAFCVPVFYALALGACASEPFIHDADQFDRTAEGFGQEPTDIARVVICYASSSATPGRIVTMATEACGAFDKKPVFMEQTYLVCPLIAPVAAVYACEADDDGVRSGPDD